MKKITRLKKFFISTFALFFLGLLFYAYVYYLVVTGGAFSEFKHWCVYSKELSKLIGEFKKANLLPYGSFYEKDKGVTGLAGFSARVVGTTGVVDVKVEMSRSGYKWQVDNIQVNGEFLNKY